MNNYKLVKAEDGNVWVPLQPLMYDINANLEKLMKISITDMDKQEVEALNFGIVSLRAIHSFLGALLTEQRLTEMGIPDETVH